MKQSETQALLAGVPLLAFWYVDAYYLWQERLYCKLYDWVTTNRMNTDDFLLNLNAKRFEPEVKSVGSVMLSKSIYPLYSAILVVILLIWGWPLITPFLDGLSRG